MEKTDGYIRFRCRMCGKKLKVKSDKQGGGQVMPCPRCREMLTVPLVGVDGSVEEAADEAAQEMEKASKRLKDLVNGQATGRAGSGRGSGSWPVRKSDGSSASSAEEKQSTEAKGERWRPKFSVTRATKPTEELSDFRRQIDNIEQDAFERACSVFSDRETPLDQKREALRKIGEERDEEYYDTYQRLRDQLASELKELARRGGDPVQEDRLRMLALRHSIESLDLYAYHVLGIER